MPRLCARVLARCVFPECGPQVRAWSLCPGCLPGEVAPSAYRVPQPARSVLPGSYSSKRCAPTYPHAYLVQSRQERNHTSAQSPDRRRCWGATLCGLRTDMSINQRLPMPSAKFSSGRPFSANAPLTALRAVAHKRHLKWSSLRHPSLSSGLFVLGLLGASGVLGSSECAGSCLEGAFERQR